MMNNLILVFILLVLVGGAAFYIIKEKRRGVKCIGCPSATVCSMNGKHCGGGCSGCQKNRE
jgi:hypothetical protein